MYKTTIYHKLMSENLFEEDFTIEDFSQTGNPIEQLAALVDFEMFRLTLEDVLVKKDCKTPAGCPQIDVVLMFQIIFLQHYYGLGDHQIKYQIIDCTNFHHFLSIYTVAEVPDEKNIWACKNKLAEDGTLNRLLDEFHTFRWTKKRGENCYGYKNHVKADKKTKFIEKYHTTDASVHDSNVIEPLIDEKDKGQDLFLDASYESQDRYHIEHIFDFVEGAMNGSLIRSIGMMRAKVANDLTDLVYNIFKHVQIFNFHPQFLTCKG